MRLLRAAMFMGAITVFAFYTIVVSYLPDDVRRKLRGG